MRLRRLFFPALAIAIALAGFAAPLRAQGSDVIRGRIVDPDSIPVEGARVTVMSIVSQIERVARTDRNGRFTIIFPGADGQYVVSISQIGFVVKAFELKRMVDEDILVADAQLQKPMLEPVVVSADTRGTIPRNSQTADISGATQGVDIGGLPPDLQGNLAAMAASIPGVLLIPGANGAADGFSVLGLDPTDNTITMNGITFDGGDLPRDAGISASLSTSPYDVSRGGFSGGELALRSSGGSNILRQGMSLNMRLPQLQWSDRTSQALGSEQTRLSLSSGWSGPIARNASFYNVSFQVDRNTNPLQTLLNTNSLGLQSQSIASDSVTRLLGLLSDMGVPTTAGGALDNAATHSASFFGSFNFNPPSSTTGSQYGMTVNANWNNTEPTSGGSLYSTLPASLGESRRYGGGISARHTAYLKIFLSETSASISASRNAASPFVNLPAGSVRINSEFADGSNGVKMLTFGGSRSNSESRQLSASFTNALSWFSTNNKHRLRLQTDVRYTESTSEQSGNLLGSFNFNSLADLEAGLPSSFSRQLNERVDESSQITGSLSLGDAFRFSPDLQFQYGVRVDGGGYFRKPEFNPALEEAFGVRNDFVPNRLNISPRIGFSWTTGTNPLLSAFEGAVRGPRAVVRGGIAVQQNALGSINSVVNNTGLPNSIQSISCVGPAAPVPDWDLYLGDPGAIPAECADGSAGTVFSNSLPSATLYSRDYNASRSVRTDLSWTGSILDNRFGLTVSAQHSMNLNRSNTVDLNFDPTVRFNLANEGGRPVFVEPANIVERTGAIASRGARVSSDFTRVNELRSDLRSETVQLRFSLNPRITNPYAPFRWSASYVFQDVREQQRGFGGGSTTGNPLDVVWSRGVNTARHQINYSLSYSIFRLATIRWNGALTSGRPYTPVISGDVNGDGSSNDRPFIFDPANTADPELASAMEQLLSNTSPDGRRCLMKQLGQLARRNSCESGWNLTGNLAISIDGARFNLPNRARLDLQFQNPMGGLDMLINGSRSPKGWGQSTSERVDPTLLYVRGFDPNTNTFRYEVNQRFGSERESFRRLSVATGVTAMISMDLGPVRERQNLGQYLSYGRTEEGSKYPASLLKSTGTNAIPNPITTLLRLQDSLRMTAVQADSIATLNRRYTIQLDSIWSAAAAILYELPNDYRSVDAWRQYVGARHLAVDLLSTIGPQIRGLLTASQLRKLPASFHNAIDPRYLHAVRNGTGVYVTPSGGLGGSSAASFLMAERIVMSSGSVIVR